MKKKRILILVLQLVIIIATAVGFYTFSQNTVKPTEVYTYTKDIVDVSEPIKEEDIRLTSIPSAAVTSDFATVKEDIVGKYVDGKVKAGQYVYKNTLITLEEVDPFEQMDLTKYRKISMPINFVDGFAGNIKKGDRVDLVYTGEGTIKGAVGNETFKYAKVFLQDVLVYNVNTEDGFRFKDFSSQTPGNLTESDLVDAQEMSIITLAVTLQQAEEINARMSAGLVGFLGRFESSESYNTLGYVLGDYDKIYSGQGSAETGNVIIEEDSFEIVE